MAKINRLIAMLIEQEKSGKWLEAQLESHHVQSVSVAIQLNPTYKQLKS